MPDSTTEHAITADLGPRVAAFTCRIDGLTVAVVNASVAHNPALRKQAAAALLCAGMDAGLILGALHGVRR